MAYNGWTNYETWVVNLWMGNDRPQELYWSDAARECWEQAMPDDSLTRREVAAIALAGRMQDAHRDAADDMLQAASFEVGPFADLLRASLSEVNWMEVAKYWMESYTEPSDEK